ncbi:MAG: amino acid ABC transporter permease [candidate division NC10 bacterium]|nr:amino acid ABC transporter permease [candidate division NC10 bacterium]
MYKLNFAVLLEYWPALLAGLQMTIKVSVLSIFFGTLMGVAGALAKTSRFRMLRALAFTYVEWIRNTPLLIQILFIYFGLGVFFSLSPMVASVFALSFFSGAYITEIIRAGIQSIHKGQREAAFSLGMTEGQSMFLVVLPQAVRRILPPLAGQFITLIKDSSLISVIAVSDLTYVAKNIVTNTFRAFEVWLAIAVFYFVLSFALSWSVRNLEYRLAKSD